MLNHHSDIKNIKFEQFIPHLLPLILTSNALERISSLSSKLRTTNLKKLIFPALLVFFVPPLVANLVYPQFVVNNLVIISFFSAILIFPMIVHLPMALFWMSKFGKIGRFLFLRALIHNGRPISQVTLWPILSDFVGIFLFKVIIGDHDFEITEKAFINNVSSALIVYFARIFHFTDYTLLFCIIMTELMVFTFDRFNIIDIKDTSEKMNSLLQMFDFQRNFRKEPKKRDGGRIVNRAVNNQHSKNKTKTEEKAKKKKSTKKEEENELAESLETNSIKLADVLPDDLPENNLENSPDDSPDGSESTMKKSSRGRPKKKTTSTTKKRGKSSK